MSSTTTTPTRLYPSQRLEDVLTFGEHLEQLPHTNDPSRVEHRTHRLRIGSLRERLLEKLEELRLARFSGDCKWEVDVSRDADLDSTTPEGEIDLTITVEDSQGRRAVQRYKLSVLQRRGSSVRYIDFGVRPLPLQ